MLKRNKYYSLLFFLLLFFIAVPAQSSVMKNILVLNSYHKGHEWADSIKRGVQAVVHKEEKSIEVYFEYLETKKHSHIGFSEEQVALFMSKYPSGLFDVIIVTDNNALTFVKNFGNILFPDTPVVFCGINNFRTELVDGIEQITGVVETTDYKATLELMAKLHSKAEKIAVILDKTETGLEIKKEFLKVAQSYKGRFTFEFYQDFLLEEIGAELSKLGSEDLIYLLTFNRDRNSNFISYSNSIKQLSQHSHRPIYGSWDFYMGKGILGGIITSGFEQGKLSATQALKIIAGEKTEGLPVIENIPNKCMFDYVQMKRFGIKTSQLPEDCVVINTPPTFYDKYNKIITLLSFIALFVSVILLWNFRIQKQKQALLIQMNEQLDKRIKEKTIELIETNDKLNTIIDTAPSPVFYKDKERRYRGCNDAFADKVLGLPKDQIIGHTLYEINERLPKELVDQYQSKDNELIQKPGTQFYEAKVHCPDDIYRDFLFNKATLINADGNVSGIVGVMLDISERKKAENALIESKQRFQRLLEASFGGIIIHEKGRIIDVNQGLSDMSGYSQKELLQLTGLDLIAPEWREKATKQVLSGDENIYDVEGIKKDGTIFPLEIQAKKIPYEGRMVRVTGLRDISERRKAQKDRERLIKELQKTNEKLERLSITDALTGLNNRRYIFESLTKEITKADRYGSSLSVILVDIDNFKNINDTYGHPFGDIVLQKIGSVFQDTIREIDMVGRYGGEEFLFVLPNTSHDEGALLAERLRKNTEAITWDNEGISITLSGGLVQYNGELRNELLKLADDLLYKAKSLGKNRIEASAAGST